MKSRQISKDYINSSKSAKATANFFSSDEYDALVIQISTVLYALNQKIWEDFRRKVDQAKELDKLWALEQKCEIQCFVSLFILANVISSPHFDVNDVPDGWAAMIVLGNYFDGNLYLPDLLVRLPYQTRDVVFLRAAALEHFSSEFDGKRYVLVFTNSRQLFEYLGNIEVKGQGPMV